MCSVIPDGSGVSFQESIVYLTLNGQCTIQGKAFWRVEDLDKARVGLEMMYKPSLLLLVEDWPEERARGLVEGLNKTAADRPAADRPAADD